MKRWIGPLLIATAALHTVVGIILASGSLADIVKAGIFNAVDPYLDRMAAFWFLTCGAALLLMGLMVQWGIRQTDTLPVSLGWGLMIMGIVGVIMMPVSGFWLLLPQAYMILRIAHAEK